MYEFWETFATFISICFMFFSALYLNSFHKSRGFSDKNLASILLDIQAAGRSAAGELNVYPFHIMDI